MARNEPLISQLMSELAQVNDYSVGPIERMKRDAKLRSSDFIPYFGERNYETRTFPHKFVSLFSDVPQEGISILKQIEKRKGLLESYNNTLIVCVLTASALGVRYLLSKP